MVNSASEALAEFKSKRLGTLLDRSGSTVDMGLGGISRDAMTSASRMSPKKSSTAFLDDIRASGSRTNNMLMQNIKNKQATAQQRAGAPTGASRGYQLPQMPKGGGGTGGPRGAHGLAVPAAQSFGNLSAAYAKRFGGGLTVNSGGRTREQQAYLYNGWVKRLPGFNKAAAPGTSLHESGIAIDIGGPIMNQGSAQHAWLRQNAAQFGWYWVGQKYGEPWHWEYRPG